MSSFLTSQLSSMALVLVIIQLSRRIDSTNNQNILLIRMAYGVSQLLTLAFLVFVRSVVKRRGEKALIEVEEPSKPFSQEPPKKEKISICEYDLREIGKQIQQTIISAIMLIVLHSWLGFVQPLILQAIIPWKTLLTLPIVQIHLWGFKPEGSLTRPWKAPNPFGDLFAQEEAPAKESSVVEVQDGTASSQAPKRVGGRKED